MNNKSLYQCKKFLQDNFDIYLKSIDNLIEYHSNSNDFINVKLMLLLEYREKLVLDYEQLKKGLTL